MYAVAVLTPIGYILVLFAMTMAPVSHVAPIREMSMMIGAYFGVRFLMKDTPAVEYSGPLSLPSVSPRLLPVELSVRYEP